jgi:hypothetical protein
MNRIARQTAIIVMCVLLSGIVAVAVWFGLTYLWPSLMNHEVFTVIASLLVYMMVSMVALLALVHAAILGLCNLTHFFMERTVSGIKKRLRKVGLG